MTCVRVDEGPLSWRKVLYLSLGLYLKIANVFTRKLRAAFLRMFSLAAEPNAPEGKRAGRETKTPAAIKSLDWLYSVRLGGEYKPYLSIRRFTGSLINTL